MKKFLIVTLSLLMCLSFVGCSDNNTNNEVSNDEESVADRISDIFDIEDETEYSSEEYDESYYYDEDYSE